LREAEVSTEISNTKVFLKNDKEKNISLSVYATIKAPLKQFRNSSICAIQLESCYPGNLWQYIITGQQQGFPFHEKKLELLHYDIKPQNIPSH